MNAEDMERLKTPFQRLFAEGLRHDLQQVAEGHQVILTEVQQFREDCQGRVLKKLDTASPDQRF